VVYPAVALDQFLRKILVEFTNKLPTGGIKDTSLPADNELARNLHY